MVCDLSIPYSLPRYLPSATMLRSAWNWTKILCSIDVCEICASRGDLLRSLLVCVSSAGLFPRSLYWPPENRYLPAQKRMPPPRRSNAKVSKSMSIRAPVYSKDKTPKAITVMASAMRKSRSSATRVLKIHLECPSSSALEVTVARENVQVIRVQTEWQFSFGRLSSSCNASGRPPVLCSLILCWPC